MLCFYSFVSLLSAAGFLASANAFSQKPHIIFILADDMGWNDVSFQGSPQIPTPNIDALAASGITCVRHYTAPTCTPSRAALMTGRYPSNTGLQHFVLLAGQPAGLPLNLTTMPQHLKKLGYSTHLIGKWHLGCHKTEYTPTYRGFDSFFGYWNGEIDYYDYTHYAAENMWGIDLRDGMKPIKHCRGKYAADVFTEKAVAKINKHNTSQPLFLFLSQIAPHTGNPYQPLQAPPEHVNKFKYIKDIKRRTYAGAVSVLDDSVGKVFAALHAKGMLENSIIVFTSDNGAEVEGLRGGHGSSWPLRGSKLGPFEGGIRQSVIVWSRLFRLKRPRISNQLMHLSDWMPTLYAAAGGNVRDLGSIDGINMWRHLVRNLPSPRNEILVTVDPIFRIAVLIQNDYKLIDGTYTDEHWDLWYGPSGREELNISSMSEWVWKKESMVKNILEHTGRWIVRDPDQWRQNIPVDCGSPPPVDHAGCYPAIEPCLFNITADPCEYENLASEYPEVVEDMLKRIRELNSTSVAPLNPNVDPNADPRCHGFTFVPWLDKEHASEPCCLS